MRAITVLLLACACGLAHGKPPNIVSMGHVGAVHHAREALAAYKCWLHVLPPANVLALVSCKTLVAPLVSCPLLLSRYHRMRAGVAANRRSNSELCR